MSAAPKGYDIWKFSTFLLIGIIVGYGFSQFTGGPSQVVVAPTNQPFQGEVAPSVAPVPVKVSIDDDAVLGDPDAPITVVEFSDFECPFCQKFFSNSLPSIIENYVNTGKVKLVYRDYPLASHSGAFLAAEAAECAGEQDAYYAMHDLLFQELSVWNIAADPVPIFKQFAADLGLEVLEFNACMDSHKMQAEVSADMSDGIAAGVSGTPTFFINGQKIVGAQPFSVFSGLFDSILAQ
jgi:protein-disulfide isomerase